VRPSCGTSANLPFATAASRAAIAGPARSMASSVSSCQDPLRCRARGRSVRAQSYRCHAAGGHARPSIRAGGTLDHRLAASRNGRFAAPLDRCRHRGRPRGRLQRSVPHAESHPGGPGSNAEPDGGPLHIARPAALLCRGLGRWPRRRPAELDELWSALESTHTGRRHPGTSSRVSTSMAVDNLRL
jgi:hypothetical protein